MKIYSCPEARKRLSKVLNEARKEEVLIKKRGGETFRIVCESASKSPFDVPGIKTGATTRDILEAVLESRSKEVAS